MLEVANTGADGEIVGLGLIGQAKLLGIVRRRADDHIWSRDPANRIYGKIVLPDVDAVKTGCQSQICAIVHDERNFLSKHPPEFACMRKHLP